MKDLGGTGKGTGSFLVTCDRGTHRGGVADRADPAEECKHSLLGVSHVTTWSEQLWGVVRGRLRESRDHWNAPAGHSEDFRFPPESDKELKKDTSRPQRNCGIGSRPLTKANTTIKPAVEMLWFPVHTKVMLYYTVIC